MNSENNIYQHFRSDEKSFIDAMLDAVYTVEERYMPYLTHFLNPREQHILRALIGEQDSISVRFFGGYEGAERKRAMITPPYYDLQMTDFNVQLFEVDYPINYYTLSHGQVMGSALNIGLKREVFGDIIQDDEHFQFFADAELSPFIQQELTRVGKAPVTVFEQDLKNVVSVEVEWKEKTASIASMRLDNVVAAAFNLSRQKSKEYIQRDAIKLNWKLENRVNAEVDVADMISVRGHGRIRLDERLGISRKGHERVLFSILDRNR